MSLEPYTHNAPRRRNGLAAWWCCSALALGFSAWASRAEATCGDYVMTGSDHVAMSDAMGTEQLPNPAQVTNPIPSEPVRLPCHGLSCSSHNVPVTTLHVVVRFQPDSASACLAQDDGEPSAPSRWATCAQDSLAAQDFSFRILRPPKQLALHRSARDVIA